MSLLYGIIGILSLLGIAYLLSNNRKSINVRTVLGAFFMQVLLAMFVLYIPFGQQVILILSGYIQSAINAGNVGISFVFGPLVGEKIGFVFAINVLMLVIFFSSLISVLYYLKIMPFIINTIGYAIHKLLGTSKTESLSATANIFVGQTEAPLVIKPFLNKMTKSELFAVMVGGMSSIAGSVMAGYASLGIDLKYLIAASVMAAPGSLLMAKIIMPQTETPHNKIDDIGSIKNEKNDQPVNIVEAAANGASSGLLLAANIGAMMIAFIGLVALMNMILGGIGGIFGYKELSFNFLLGYAFSPFAFMLGIPWSEAVQVGSYLGQKIIFNEFVAYLNFAKDMDTFSPKTQAIVTFALCGFANITSIGVLIGGLGSLSPKQKPFIASMAIKAVIAGTLSNFMSAVLAGIFLSF